MERKPAIVAEVLRSSPRRAEIGLVLQALGHEVEHLPVAPPPDDLPLRDQWAAEHGRWEGRTWLEVPWYFAESYFYVRLLSAIGYFAGLHPDPFAPQKAELLERCAVALPDMARAAELVAALPDEQAFAVLARRSLWGNRIDLSNVAVAERHAGRQQGLEDTVPVVDDCLPAFRALAAGNAQVTVLCDNSGPELLADLQLCHWLLGHGVEQVCLEVKPQPFFVSDAMAPQVDDSVTFLDRAEEAAVARVGRGLREALNKGHLVVRDHPFWCGPGHYRDLPADLVQRLTTASLVISKGDVNYRRFLADRHWPFHTPIAVAVGAFPAPALLLRTFKGELAAGLSRELVQELSSADGDWLINGRQGVAQFVPASRGGA